MIFPLRVFGSDSVKRISAGRASLPISRATCSLSSSRRLVVGLDALQHRDEGADRLAQELVGRPTTAGLGHLGVADERALDLHRREAVSGDVDHVVDAPEDPEVAALVAPRAVAGEVQVPELRPVVLAVALGIAPDAAQHRGPGLADHEVAAVVRGQLLALVVDDGRVDAEEGPRRRARLRDGQPGQRRDRDRARLRLPPRVDDRAALVPMLRWYHIHASGLIGSPTEPSKRSEDKSYCAARPRPGA
jgi:hypothetical protein